jgi:hypothetical protein
MMSSSANLNRARNAAHLSQVQSADASNVSISAAMTWRVTLMKRRPAEPTMADIPVWRTERRLARHALIAFPVLSSLAVVSTFEAISATAINVRA